MRYAIVSDVHNRSQKLQAVLADAQARQVDQILSLGDIGGPACLTMLRDAGAEAVFGNYEVSGWRRLPAGHRAWVRGWPPLWQGEDLIAVHAAPWWPEGLHTVTEFGAWLERTGSSWRTLFPYLDAGTDALWQAFAELEVVDKAILFHGHTHHQAVWRWLPSSRLKQVHAARFKIVSGSRYAVGVGSVGLPEDGSWAAYVVYDADARQIDLIRLASPRP
ncbi:MAG: metallophosphoesterase family protein [Anaerolineae bacterium]|jgi:diadenosine tetraphosphatase ApaH/serine/threonine PP2A family protein phosphatase